MAEIDDPGEPIPFTPTPDPYARYTRDTTIDEKTPTLIMTTKPDYNIAATGVLAQRVVELKSRIISKIWGS